MFSIRATTLGVAGVLSVLTLGACSKQNAPKSTESAASAVPIVPEAVKVIEVRDVELGRHIGPDRKIRDKTVRFSHKDTIYAVVATRNPGTGKLTARWTGVGGKVVSEENQTITPTGDTSTAFFIAAPPTAGKYTVHILLNDAEVKTKDVTVKK